MYSRTCFVLKYLVLCIHIYLQCICIQFCLQYVHIPHVVRPLQIVSACAKKCRFHVLFKGAYLLGEFCCSYISMLRDYEHVLRMYADIIPCRTRHYCQAVCSILLVLLGGGWRVVSC